MSTLLSHPAPTPNAGRVPDEAAIPVVIHHRCRFAIPDLAAALGPGYRLTVGETATSGILILPGVPLPPGGPGRADITVLVILPPGSHSTEMIEFLDRGADACISGPTAGELAAHVKALCRRPRR